MSRRSEQTRNVLLTILIILLTVGLVALLIYVKARENERKQELEELRAQISEERTEAREEQREQQQEQEEEQAEEQQEEEEQQAEEKKESDSFYQKLADGFDVNILIVGDAVGAGVGAETANLNWVSRLQIELMTRYKVNVGVTNVSMGGENGSYAGYARVMSLNDGASYDLAILCCGATDPPEGFSQTYESVIRAVMGKYPTCAILSVLENSQEPYGEKAQAIRTLTNYYGIPIVDTVTPFGSNAVLTSDGVHPNNEGQRIYFEEILKAITGAVEAYKGYDLKSSTPLNAGVDGFNSCQYIAASEFQREGELNYVLSLGANGCIGIDYDPSQGANKTVTVSADNVPIATLQNDYGERTIVKIADNCQVTAQLRISFRTREAADRFYGIYVSDAV